MNVTLEGSQHFGRMAVCQDDIYLTELPPGFSPFEEFDKEFNLGATSTELLHPVTKSLSQSIHKCIPEGLELLLNVDENVIKGLEEFIPDIDSLAPLLSERMGSGGRVFLVGSGSSGRVAIDLAAKCNQAFPEKNQQVRGVIAGGDSALIRAKEGFEDSESDGMKALEEFNLGPQDTVILISASGSASFNVGCGHYSAEKGAQVLYFYNSKSIPSRTQQLFDRKRNPVIPLCIDIGPQAIAGSTRLQGATLAEACLGALLASSLYMDKAQAPLAKEYPKLLISKMQEGIALIRKHLAGIEKFVTQEKEIFSDPRSNFRQLKDVTDQGYVTFVSLKDSIREVKIDSTETSPTFSTNPVRRLNEQHKKRAEFQAYLAGELDNREAWKALLGREVSQTDVKDTDAFILSSFAEGINSYQNRPKGKGNFVIGVAKLKNSLHVPKEILQALEEAKKQGGRTGLILTCRDKLSEKQNEELAHYADAVLVLENVPHDAMGLSETIILKQTLNLISNGSMVLMNKVHGNQMIDVRASNKKLIDRCIRLIKEIWKEYSSSAVLSNKELYHYVAHVSAIKKAYEEKGVYTPSVVKIVLAMLSLKKTPKNFQEIVDILAEKQERIDWIGDTLTKGL